MFLIDIMNVQKFSAKHILRITGDCPLIDPQLVDKMLKIYKK